ncbi:MAG TPA: IS30 family transposase [Candidatus Moranbacteria bacterium]|nr:IS30 family transposase [Candidatus Moranbacteria bacterium]
MKQNKYRRISFIEREEISRCLASGLSIRRIAGKTQRNPGDLSREVKKGGGREKYRAHLSQYRAERRRKKQGRKKKLEIQPKLKEYVFKKLFIFWSPEQIANSLKMDYPEDTAMRISPETIYSYAYIQPKGELKKLLVKALRRHHYKRHKKNRKTKREVINIPNMVSIEERPEEAEKRTIAGHWEGDLLIGKLRRSGLGTIVERATRKVILVPLKEKDHITVARNFSKELNKIPKKLRKTMTYDRGSEMSSHEKITANTKIKVYFAHSGSPWERGTNENTNGLIRQFFSKGTDFAKLATREIKKVEKLLNERPRKTLNWKTPEEVFKELVLR